MKNDTVPNFDKVNVLMAMNYLNEIHETLSKANKKRFRENYIHIYHVLDAARDVAPYPSFVEHSEVSND